MGVFTVKSKRIVLKQAPFFFWSSNLLVGLLHNLIGPRHILGSSDLTRAPLHISGNIDNVCLVELTCVFLDPAWP